MSDFDRTLTPHRINGEKTTTSFAQFRTGGYFGDGYAKKAMELFEYYHPIENSLDIDEYEKTKQMKKWWREHLELLIENKISMKVIEDIIEKGKLQLRAGAKDFFELLSEKEIPLLIISAGVGDLIKTYLNKLDLLQNNVYLLSNCFEFDENGIAVKIKEPVISISNKAESELDENYKELINGRDNIVLMGDKLEDLSMANAFNVGTVLSVGFFNEGDEKMKQEFMNSFDIVIEGDGDLSEVNDLIREIAKS